MHTRRDYQITNLILDETDQQRMQFLSCKTQSRISSEPLFLCFLDLKAAYDWINRDMLFNILEIRINSPILVNMLEAFYAGTLAAVKGSFFQNVLWL